MDDISHRVRRFARDRSGSMALVVAVMLPLMAVGAAAAVDYANLARAKIQLQKATDASALAAARELRLLSTMPDVNMDREIDRVAQGVVAATLADDDPSVTVDASELAESAVRVEASSEVPLLLGPFLGTATERIAAHAVAQVLGGSDVCAVALGATDQYTLDLNNEATVTGPGCAIYSNSTHHNGLAASESSRIEAAQICSAGGVRGSSAAFRPAATTDCAPLQDPLIGKLDPIPALAGGSCVDTAPTHLDGLAVEKLAPGRYCHGVTVAGDVTLTLEPGVYVFDDSILTIAGDAIVRGEDVALVFTGANSRMIVGGNAELALGGRVSGEMAGMLIVAEPRPDGTMREFTITSAKVRELVGTIYLPGDYLNILTNSPVAAESAFTVVMARRIKLHGSASLVLNRDYASTTVPKSGGLRDYGGGLALVR